MQRKFGKVESNRIRSSETLASFLLNVNTL